MTILSGFWTDFRYAARSLSRKPGFAAAAIVTIALGLGVSMGIFTVLNGVLLRDLPAPRAHELVAVSQRVDGVQDFRRSVSQTFSLSEYRTYRDAQTLSGVLAHANLGTVSTTTLGGDVPAQIAGTLVSCNYFAVLQQPPALGRAFTEQDCANAAPPVVVLGHELWTGAFAADPAIVGRTIEINRELFTVVGVAAEGTYGGSVWRIGYFAPLGVEPLLRRDGSRYEDEELPWLNLIGRRVEGANLEQVRAELAVMAGRIDRLEPGRSTTLTIERATRGGEVRFSGGAAAAATAVLMAPFALILLIACANVANLLLARGTTRSGEIGIRLALGASRASIVRQLLAESLLISLAGGALGFVLGLWSFQALVAFALPALEPRDLPLRFVWDFSPDARVLSFAVVLTFGTSLLFGLAPALQASKPDLAGVIKQDSAGTGNGRGGGRLRGTLVGVQVAFCMALMVAAGLLLRSLYVTSTADLGFEYRDVAFASLEPVAETYDSAELAALKQRLIEEVEALPGVEAVAYASQAPLGDGGRTTAVRLPGESVAREARVNEVGPAYFSLLGIPIIRGQVFTEADVANRAADVSPALVSETTARNLWPGSDPIGRTFLREVRSFQDGTLARRNVALQVVGVVADAQVSWLGEVDPYFIYVPGQDTVLLVKSRTGFAATASAIQSVVRALDPDVAISVNPLETNVAWLRGIVGVVTTLGAALGALALVLSSVGIYGVVSYSVNRRYREMGIRMALGARAPDLLGMVLRQTMRPVVAGAVVGVAAAVAVSILLSSLLLGVSPADPIGLGGAALFVLAIGFASGVMAARPATRADPTVALRYE